MQQDGYTPDATDAAYIEATAAPVHAVFAAIETAALRAFNAAVLGDPTWHATILPVGDGLLVATPREAA